jgi:Protein of unknown function (DUF3551)
VFYGKDDAALRHVEEIEMRNALLAILALSAATAATVAGSSPAAAFDYPYCLQGRGIGIPGECSYATYEQCMASASGRALYCNINPRVAYGPPRRMRVYRDY